MTETFRNLIAWQKAKTLATEIYRVTSEFPTTEQYGMTAQLRRATVSIPSNIAEGKGRETKRDFCHFLVQARGSLYEIESQVEIAKDLHYLDQVAANKLFSSCDELARILNGLINSTK